MGALPKPILARGVRGSSIINLAAPPTVKGPALPTAHPLLKAGAVVLRGEDLKGLAPEAQILLTRVIAALQANINEATEPLRSNPHGAPCIVRGVVMGGTGQYIIHHSLGRAYTGWWCCRAYSGGPWSGNEVLPTDSAYPVGYATDRVLVLATLNTGTYDFCITGD